jgi:DNA excision repair protein ERCC-4
MTATASALPSLPTVKASEPGALPTIVVDSREQTPLPIRRLPTVEGGLYTGDYSIRGMEASFAVERKSIADLVTSVGPERSRFERELHRLRSYDFARLLVIGTEQDIRTGNYRSRMNPKSVLHSLWAYEARYRLLTVFAATPEAGAALVERWAYFYTRETIRRADGLFRGIRNAEPEGARA